MIKPWRPPPTSSGSVTLDEHRSEPVPAMLYHFTSSEGLIGIVKSEALYVTDLAYLNDTEERRHGIRVFERVIERAKTDIGEKEYEALQGLLNHINSVAKAQSFVASFARQKSLAMYRMYCPPNDGYCLGIPGVRLDDMAKANGFLLYPCIYNLQIQERICEELIDSFIKGFRDHQIYCQNLNPPVVPAYPYNQQTAEFAYNVMMRCCLPLFKHQSFDGEHEWRLIADGPYKGFNDSYAPHASDDEKKQVDVSQRLFRKGMRGITPYVLFPLHRVRAPSYSEEYRFNVMHCEVGPSATDQQLRENAVKRLFQPFEEVEVKRCDTTYLAGV